ncbi:pentatricopeptide repeat-containing protein [Tanacetum coccineum]
MAWAVVSIENSKNWLWFLSNLGSDFNLAMGAYLTILSDGHKGLIEAVKELLPHAEHRLSSTLQDCAAFENGISESYHSAIEIARTKPIISMLEEIRVYLMQRIVTMNQKAVNLNDIICPAIRKELEKLKKYQRYWQVVPCGQQLFEVRKANKGFGVNLNIKTCTCKRWNLSGISCIHAVVAYCMLNQDPGKGVSSWYSKQMWVDVYSHFIKPVGGSSIWVKSENPPPLPLRRGLCQATNQPFNPPNIDPSSADLSFVDPSSADPSAANLSFADPSFADLSSADPSAADPSFADPSLAYPNAVDPSFADLNQSFTGILNCVEQHSMGVEIVDAEIVALADMNEVEEREARRKDDERVLKEAKKKEVYRKRGAGGWRGPSERIANQRRKKEDHLRG